MRALIALVRDGRLLRTAVVSANELEAFLKGGWQFVAFDPSPDLTKK